MWFFLCVVKSIMYRVYRDFFVVVQISNMRHKYGYERKREKEREKQEIFFCMRDMVKR